MCSTVANTCMPPHTFEDIYDSSYTCLMDGYQKSIDKLEEIGQSEIQSSIIGRKVMDELKELDKIAYIRFASVYTNFKEIGEFGEYIDELHGKSKKK